MTTPHLSSSHLPRPVLTLYELAGADAALRFSPHCWKSRMALAHKGLEVERLPWRFTDKAEIAFSGQGMVPVLRDGDDSIADSWRIALYLEQRYPDRPSLFGGDQGQALTRFINAWADTAMAPLLAPVLVLEILSRLDAKDRDYFRTTREARYGRRLEEVCADREARVADFRKALTPLRTLLKEQPFLAGATPAYADYCVFGMFMWARCISDVQLLEADDTVYAWRERLLDAFDGLARGAPAVGAIAA
ncbi:glutathione S-transferase family protein [Azorhizobium sp. AG788]|uniref:glutathione S-transferase family protein n=1 Tax=Azorhizobium sp. AG788 TaxID=2183897 RepID=UPI00313A0A4C